MGSHRLVGVQMHAFLQSSTPEAASIPKTYQEHYKEEGMTAEMANSYKTKRESGTRWVNHHHIHFRVYNDSLGSATISMIFMNMHLS